MRERGEPLRIALACHQRIEHRAPAPAQHVGEHGVELDVGILQRLVDALGVTGLLAHQLLAGAQESAQVLRRAVRHEACPDQAMRQEFGEPGGVAHVGLAPRHVLHMRGVRQNKLQFAVGKHVPDRPPVHAGRLHGDLRAVVLRKPVRQRQQTRRGGRKRPHFGDHLAVQRQPNTGHHRFLVHIKTGATLMQKLHDILQCAAGKGPRQGSLINVLHGRTDRWRQSGVLQGPTVQLRIGLNCTKEIADLRADDSPTVP